MTRCYNFSPGPAMLPNEVMQQAQEEFMDWHGKGLSAMELGHRTTDFTKVREQTEADLRELLHIPSHYKVLFTTGGATAQFAMVPLNILRGKNKADYIHTGIWSGKAINEAKRYCQVNVAASSAANNFTDIPSQDKWQLDENAAYVHYTPNETIQGVEFHWVPDTGNVPLVVDMSSTILSRPIDVTQYGVIYAGAQKNIGQAGITIVIVREDLIGDAFDLTPTLYKYSTYAETGSAYNTPPTYAWYICGLVLQWLKRQGGTQVMAERNRKKSHTLYQYIDNSEFYQNPVVSGCRSWMNIPFVLKDSTMDERFLEDVTDAGLLNLKGHRLVGGMRASLYNAMPQEGVDALIEFMKAFAKRYG